MTLTGQIQTHFGLSRPPFEDTVNPQFFYQTEAAERAFFRMEHCIESARALGLVWGPSGTGKTLLSQLILEQLDTDRFLPILALATPKMSKTDVLREILSELEIEDIPRFSFPMIDCLHQRILREERNHRRVVILFDEAHFLSSDALHLLRTLSNLETTQLKLVTVILFAEPGFVRRIQHPAYASLCGRISFRARLDPLTVEETEQYVKFRILVSGGSGGVFTPECYPMIQQGSKGIPRNISRIADNALLEAFLARSRMVTQDILARAISRDSWTVTENLPEGKNEDSSPKVLKYGA